MIDDDIKLEILNCVTLAFESALCSNLTLSKIFVNNISILYDLLAEDTYDDILKIFLYIIGNLGKIEGYEWANGTLLQEMNTVNEKELNNEVIIIIIYLHCLKSM